MLRDDDTNTSFFHARASTHARRNPIHILEVDGVSLIAHSDKMAVLNTYYTSILGTAESTS